jgi:predicted GIY-YIG superfamily endonuclease
MRWIYILKCSGGYYYVGETTRLYRRFWEHQSGRGGMNTSIFTPETIVAIYKVNTIGKFFEYNDGVKDSNSRFTFDDKMNLANFNCEPNFEYNNLLAENLIAECMMLHNPENWKKIIGGKYVRCIEYRFPSNSNSKDLPLCHCGLPCDIKKNEDKNFLYFRCAKKNMWEGFREQFGIEEEPCKFYMEYSKDKEKRLIQERKDLENSKYLSDLFVKSFWLRNIPIYDFYNPQECVGECNRGTKYTRIVYNNNEIRLCFSCFKHKNEDLAEKYKINLELIKQIFAD